MPTGHCPVPVLPRSAKTSFPGRGPLRYAPWSFPPGVQKIAGPGSAPPAPALPALRVEPPRLRCHLLCAGVHWPLAVSAGAGGGALSCAVAVGAAQPRVATALVSPRVCGGCSIRPRPDFSSTRGRPAPWQHRQRVSAPLPKKGKRPKGSVQSRCSRCWVLCPRFRVLATRNLPMLLLVPGLASWPVLAPLPPRSWCCLLCVAEEEEGHRR